MKIYTKTGDQGKSSLFSGERVPKNHPRIKAYGDVDELNSVIGAMIAVLPPGTEGARSQLNAIQSDLFRAGAVLATTAESDRNSRLRPITAEDIHRLEDLIDAMQVDLPELKSFILPGGHMSSAFAHMARTICRRVERGVVTLVEGADGRAPDKRPAAADLLIYLNRLSDYLFMVARYCNAAAGVDDVLWQNQT